MYLCLPIYLNSDFDHDAKEKRITTENPKVATSAISMGSSKLDTPLFARHTTATTTKYYITKAPLIQSQSGPGYSRDDITSADAPELTFTPDPLMSTTEEAMSSTTYTTTKANQKRIQWHRQFGYRGKHRQRLNRLHRPSIMTQTPTTIKTTNMIPTTTPAAPATTMYSYTTRKESSSDNDFEDVFSADYEPTIASPILRNPTMTIPSYNTFTNTQTSPPIRTIDSPPTVNPPSRARPDEAFSSGSGGYPEDWHVIKQRPKGAGGHIGRRRKPIRGRRPFRRPTTTTEAPTTTQRTTHLKPTIDTTMKSPKKQFPVSTPLYTPFGEYDGSTGMESNEDQTNVYGEDKWHVSIYTTPQTQTMTKGRWATIPKSTSTTITTRPSTTKSPATTYRAVVNSNIRPTERNRDRPTDRPTEMPNRPTMKSNSGMALTFDSLSITTAEQEYPTTATTAGIDLPTAKRIQSKPKILGGNAASFTVLSNSDAFLPCEAVGNPEPAIRWMRFSSSTGKYMLND